MSRETGYENRKRPKTARALLVALAILAVAMGIRFLYLPHIQALPTFGHPVMDAAYHDEWAREVASGRLTADEPFFRAPLYPYLLGLTYRLTGGSYLVPRVLQFILGALTALLTYSLARKLINPLAGIVAGLLAALYPVLIYFEGELLTETLFVFLVMVSLYLFTLSAEKQRSWGWFLAGLALGGALITRPTVAIFIPFAVLGALLFARRRAVHTLLVVLGVLIALAPVTAHNMAASGEFIPLVWQGGLNFYLGNNPAASGWSATSPELRKDWWGGYYDHIAIAREELGKEPGYAEISDYWTRRGLDYMRNHPADWVKLMLKKTALFWGSNEFPNNLDFNFMKLHSWVLRNPLFTFATVAPLALLGLVVLVPGARRLYFLYAFFLTFFVGSVAFFVCSRYRMPAVPVMMIFAGGAVAWLVDSARARKARRVTAAAVGLAAAAVLVSLNLAGISPPGLAQSYTVLANVYRDEGRASEAAIYYGKSVEENPSWAEGYEGLGLIALEEGDTEKAEAYFNEAIRAEPTRATSYRSLAMLYVSRGELAPARSAVESAIRYAPYLEDSHNILGTIERQEGNIEAAIALFEKEKEINPVNWRAYANLASVYDEAGDLHAAIRAYEEAMALNPGEPDIVFALATVYARSGQEDRAQELMGRIEGVQTESATFMYNRAVLLQNEGKNEEAGVIYESILAREPSHEGALVNLGVVYARQGRNEEAIELWERALEVNPGNRNARRNIDLLRERMSSGG
jgi:tetratricopeptide (TPR) repeat protein